MSSEHIFVECFCKYHQHIDQDHSSDCPGHPPLIAGPWHRATRYVKTGFHVDVSLKDKGEFLTDKKFKNNCQSLPKASVFSDEAA